MRITRVTKIRGHRVFRDFSWPSDLHAFDQFNLIYGWNGCGKTTLSSLFAQIEKGTNLTEDEGDVEFEIHDDRRCAGATIASTNLPPVRVFNRDFIDATITAVGERFEPIYYLGEDSIEKQAKADELKTTKEDKLRKMTEATATRKASERTLDRFCIDRAKVIKEVLTGAQSRQYNNYNKKHFNQSMAAMQTRADAQAALLTDEVKDQLRTQKDAQPKGDLPAVACTPPDFEKFSNDAKTLLERSVASETIEALEQDKTVARWVHEGLALHSGEQKTDTCRFCSQPLTEERRAALDGHFNDAFAAFQQEMVSEISSLDRSLADLKGITFPDPARVYDHLQEALTTATSEAQKAIELATAWLTEIRTALDAKKAAPFAPAKSGDWRSETTADALRHAIEAVNGVLAKHNNITSDFQKKVDEACNRLEQHYVAEAWDEHARLAKPVGQAEAKIESLQEEVNRLQNEIEDIERDIVEHRKPAEELNNELRAYLGRDELRFEVKSTGYSLTRAGKPVSHLSEGERTAIAFLYFLKSLKDRAFDLAKGVVVIDDPVSSLDANALFSAFGYMKERTKACGQLFVLTHNFGFFRQVKNWFHHLPKQNSSKLERRPGRFFLLCAATDDQGNRSAAIRALDPLLEQYESEYHYLFRRVYDEAKNGNGVSSLEHHYAMPNIARRLVESFLSFRYPDCAGDLAKCFERVEFDGGKKTRILRLLHTYSHAGGIAEPEHDPSVLAETRPVLGEILEMIKAVDPTHYAGMEQLVNGKEALA